MQEKEQAEKLKKEKSEQLINAIKDVLLEVDRENEKIARGEPSPWIYEVDLHKVCLHNDVVKPEMSELLEHAQKDEIYSIYGKKYKKLASIYHMTDTPKDLFVTALGKNIYEVDNLFREF